MAQEEHTSKSDKKKKSKASDIKDTIKKIRLRGIQDYPTVLWKSSQDAFALRQQCPVYERPQQPYALLPDWQQLLKDRPAVFSASHVATNPVKDEQEDNEWEDMSGEDDGSDQSDEDEDEEEVDENEDEEEAMGMQDIDPEMLKSVLAARLSASGMAGKDQTAMMEAMMQMLAGGNGAGTDELLESLTSNMLNQVSEEGGDSSMGQWLSGQGVSLDEDHDDDEQGDVTPGAPDDSSPKDSVAAEPPAAPKSSEPSIEALLEPQSTGKKRKHPLSEEIKQDEAPTQPTLDEGPTYKRSKQENPKSSSVSTQSKTSTRRPAVSQSKRKTADEKPTAKPKTTAPAKTRPETTKATRPKPTTTQAKENIPSSAPTTDATTRKRKAADEQIPDEKPKRQLRNFAAPTASSQNKTAEAKTSETKITRSGRARK